jgi:hypothetical protein
LSDRAFIKQAHEYLSMDLDPSTQYPPMIVNGRLNESWLNRLTKIRRLILRAVRRKGPLAGEPPKLQLRQIAALRRGVPLSAPARVGTIHLDKGLDVPAANRPDRGGTSVSMTLALDEPPYAVALCAFPQWWNWWQAGYLLPMSEAVEPSTPPAQQSPGAGSKTRHQGARENLRS